MREVAKRWKAGRREEGQYKMIEALVHNLGKATWGRFGDHAKSSAELLRKAGFEDAAVLRLIERHHKSSSDDDSNLHQLQMADRPASSHRADGGTSANLFLERKALPKEQLKAFFRKVLDYLKATDKFGFELEGRKAKDFVRIQLSRLKIPSIEGRPKDLALRIEILHLLEKGERSSYQIWKDLSRKGISKDKRLVGRVLEELETVNVLERDVDKKYDLKKSLAPKHSFREACYRLPSDEKLRDAIIEMHFMGFYVDGIAYQTGLPELHVKNVLEGEIERMWMR